MKVYDLLILLKDCNPDSEVKIELPTGTVTPVTRTHKRIYEGKHVDEVSIVLEVMTI